MKLHAKKLNLIFTSLAMILQLACGASTTNDQSGIAETCSSSDPAPTGGAFTGAANNALTVVAGSCGYNGINMPCANVTICEPGTANCQTITNVLIDTGSYGLRIFTNQITSITLPPMTTTIALTTYNIAECARFGTGADWGQVKYADIQMAGEPAISNMPIQVIDSTFAASKSKCSSGAVDSIPSDAGFNGIIGVGLSIADCGAYCVGVPNNGAYFKCSGNTCTGVTLPQVCDQTGNTACQVSNPVAYMPIDTGTIGHPQDNNGVILEFAHVNVLGAGSLTGHLLFGIDTRANNASAAQDTFTADASNQFSTVFMGTTLPDSFIDSGSNGLFFPIDLPNQSGFYYPYCASVNYEATNTGVNSTTNTVQFQVANPLNYSGGTAVFSNIAGAFDSQTFDWGFPFFLGRQVFVGIDSKASNLGTGPYWAY